MTGSRKNLSDKTNSGRPPDFNQWKRPKWQSWQFKNEPGSSQLVPADMAQEPGQFYRGKHLQNPRHPLFHSP